MDYKSDIMFDIETGDIVTSNGSVVFSDCTNQDVFFILSAQQGEYKNYPETGVGINSYVNSPSTYNLDVIIGNQLKDNGTIKKYEQKWGIE